MKKCLLFFVFICNMGSVYAQKSDSSFVELARIKTSKNELLAKFSHKVGSKTTAFELKYNKSKSVTLKNLTTKKNVEEYKQVIPPNTTTEKTCEEQYKAQYDEFKANMYPTIIANANRTCTPQRYCIIYYCNGVPTLAVMYLFRPTSINCKYTFLRLSIEKAKYKFN